MSNKPKENKQHQIVELEPMDMHGPMEVQVFIHVILPDGQAVRLRFLQPGGQIPAPEDFLDYLEAAGNPENQEASGLPKGTRLMTKPEFVAMYTKRETGVALQLPGEQDFVPYKPIYATPREIILEATLYRKIGGPATFAGTKARAELELMSEAELCDEYNRLAPQDLAIMKPAGSC